MKKTIFFVRIFDISPCGFTQIPSGGARWMSNLTSSPTQNLSKNTGRYVENTNKKSSFLL